MNNDIKVSTLISIKETFKYIKQDKFILIFILTTSFVAAGAIVCASLFVGDTLNLLIKYLEDKKLTSNELLNIFYSSLITSGLYLIHFIINSNILIWSVKLSYRTGSRIRYGIFTKILSVPISYIDKNKVGDLMSRSTNDVDMMIVNLVQFMVSFFISPFVIVAALITIFIISPLLSLVSILIMVVIFCSTYIFAKLSSTNFIKTQDKLAQLNAINEEFLVNKIPILLFEKQKYALEKFQKINNSHQKHTYKAEYKIGMVYPLLDLLENIAYGFIYVIGFIFMLLKTPQGSFMELNLGNLATFVLLVRLANGEIGNIARFGSIIEKLFACLKRIYSLINIPNDVNNDGINIEHLDGNIEFKNVCFSYTKEKPIIKNFNLSIKKGQKVAIIGPTGSGKTTITNLLMRFYEIDSGEILIDGINIKEINKDSLRRQMSIVLQETSLFSESIYENISYGHHKERNNSLIRKAAKEIGSYHYIALLENQFDTVIEDNSSISSGEAQLLALTRAYYSPSNILILDEATSNIDSKTEHDIQQGMIKLMKNKTALIIAHRLSTIINSDLIVVMKDGEIVEQGTHKKLLKQKGLYYKLYKNNNLMHDE